MAAWMATEFWSTWGSDLAITLTPASEAGALEVYLDGEKIFDKGDEDGKYPDLARVRKLKEVIKAGLEGVGAEH
jgi:predicted Rdx family selenoprotein